MAKEISLMPKMTKDKANEVLYDGKKHYSVPDILTAISVLYPCVFRNTARKLLGD